MKLISIIVPCYNEVDNIMSFFKEIEKIFTSHYDFELVFINDGSSDDTESVLNKILLEKKCKIKVINFSRNFGKESAMYAGISNCNGDYACFIDADLQQDPQYILKMLEVMENNKCDSVVCYQDKRKESFIKKLLKNIFYQIYNQNSDTYFHSNASDFRLINKKIIKNIQDLKEKKRFSKGIFSYVGYKSIYIPYEVKERKAGKTKWSLKKLLVYASDGIYSFTKIPLKLISLFSFIFLVAFLIQFIVNIINGDFTGMNFLYLVIYFSTYLFMISILILARYLYNIYQEVLNRPIYIIDSILENDNK